MCRKARREWRPDCACNRNAGISRGGNRESASRRAGKEKSGRGNPHMRNAARRKRCALDWPRAWAADVRRSESGGGVVVRGEMEIEFGGMQRVRGRRAGPVDAGEHWETGCRESGVGFAAGGTAARLDYCEVGAGSSSENEIGKDGSGKSAMKKRDGLDSTEAILTWPQGETRESALHDFAGILQNELAETWRACGVFEWIALGYMALSSGMIAVFARNLAHPLRLVVTQAFVSFLILALSRIAATSEQRAIVSGETFSTRFWHFWRHWYPHLFFLFCFEELGKLVHLVNPGWQDAKLIAFDYWLTGVHPALWLEQFATAVRNDFFQFAYFTYFTYLLIVGGVLYWRRDWEAYWATMTYSAAGYAIGYCIAMIFPIQSPWFAMAGMWHSDLQGGPFTATVNFIEHFGRVRGAAFPSEHVAGSVAALWGAWRHRRWLFWTLLPLAACMCVATVWGRYHYVADVLAGIATGTLGYANGSWLMKQRRKRVHPGVFL